VGVDLNASRSVHVGRQAIYDRDGDVVAYELLFRQAVDATYAGSRSAAATSQVIVAAFAEFGVEQLVGQRVCFVNVTREFLTGELPLPFDATQVGVEVLADVAVDDAVLAGVQALAEQGFTVAVDQFGADDRQEQLLPFASYAKIDMLENDQHAVATAILHCGRYPHLQLVAERLETAAAVEDAMSLGFQLFQGHALGQPHGLSAQTLGATRLQRIRLLVELNSGEVELSRAATIVEHDPELSVRVLRMVNNPTTGVRRRVSSVADAVVMLGARRLQHWVTLMLTADAADADEAALTAAVTHARLCRLVADRRGADADAAFTAGLLSAVSKRLGVTASELAAQLPLNDQLAAALNGETGALTDVLHAVDAYERGHGDVDGRGVLAADVLDAIRWSNAFAPAVAVS
jgi:c-di-GMP-related signal transduction protein